MALDLLDAYLLVCDHEIVVGDKPRPGGYYQIVAGDTILGRTGIASRAFMLESRWAQVGEAIRIAKAIANHPRNKGIVAETREASTRALGLDRSVSMRPRWAGTPTTVAERFRHGEAFAVIYVPTVKEVELLQEPMDRDAQLMWWALQEARRTVDGGDVERAQRLFDARHYVMTIARRPEDAAELLVIGDREQAGGHVISEALTAYTANLPGWQQFAAQALSLSLVSLRPIMTHDAVVAAQGLLSVVIDGRTSAAGRHFIVVEGAEVRALRSDALLAVRSPAPWPWSSRDDGAWVPPPSDWHQGMSEVRPSTGPQVIDLVAKPCSKIAVSMWMAVRRSDMIGPP